MTQRRSGPRRTPLNIYDLDTDVAVQGMNYIVSNLVAEIKRLRREIHGLRSGAAMKANPPSNCQFRGLDDTLYVSAWSYRGHPATYSFYRSERAHVDCLRRVGLRPDHAYVGSGQVLLGTLLTDLPRGRL